MIRSWLASLARSALFLPWKNQIQEINRYWELYGGWPALLLSPYAHISVILGLICAIAADDKFDPGATIVAVVPAVLGVTVTALAIILAFSTARFFSQLTEDGHEKSVFMKTFANFVHFIIVQVIALSAAIIYSAHPTGVGKFLCSIIIFYAIFTTLVTVIQLFQMATVFNASSREHVG